MILIFSVKESGKFQGRSPVVFFLGSSNEMGVTAVERSYFICLLT